MLPSALVSTYSKYKQDTNFIAAWLASTAEAAGCSPLLLVPDQAQDESGKPQQPAASARLKGKARKMKKAEEPIERSVCIIEIKQFVPLAEYIAKRSIGVPRIVVHTIKRVIDARSEFGVKLEQHGHHLNADSDASHHHFVEVLKKVLEMLEPLVPTSQETVALRSTTSGSIKNRFAGLSVQESSQAFIDAPTVNRPAIKANVDEHPAIYEAADLVSLGDALFAFSTLLADIDEVRSQIHSIWLSYRTGGVELAAAAITTNTAIGMVKEISKDILPLLDSYGGYAAYIEVAWLASSERYCSAGASKDAVLTVASGTYYHTYLAIGKVLGLSTREQVLCLGEKFSKVIEQGADSREKSEADKSLEDVTLLTAIVLSRCASPGAWPVKDELLCGLAELEETRQIPLHLVFAAQIFLDGLRALVSEICRPFDEIKTRLESLREDTRSFCDSSFASRPREHKRLDSLIMEAQRLLDIIPWILSNPAMGAVYSKENGRKANENEQIHGGPNMILRLSPVNCGLMLFYCQGHYRAFAFPQMHLSHTIKSCLHLYTALAHQKLLQRDWSDLATVYTELGADSFFVGGEKPTNRKSSFTNLALHSGMSAERLAKLGSNRLVKLLSPKGARALNNEASPALAIFARKYGHEGRNDLELPAEVVHRITQSSLFDPHCDDSGAFSLRRITDTRTIRTKKQLVGELKNTPWGQLQQRHPQGACPSIGELTKSLALMVNAESSEYFYPYLKLQRTCMELTDSLREQCAQSLSDAFKEPTAKLYEHDSGGKLVLHIPHAANSSIDPSVSIRPLQVAAEQVNRFLQQGRGDEVLRSIPDQLRPCSAVGRLEDSIEKAQRRALLGKLKDRRTVCNPVTGMITYLPK